MNFDQLLVHRKGTGTKRWHTEPVLIPETVGHHSCNVALICLFLVPNASRALLTACLIHDSAEADTGDIPAPAKWAYPNLKQALEEIEQKHYPMPEISPLDRDTLKEADTLDLLWKCVDEAYLGNREMIRIYNTVTPRVYHTLSLRGKEIAHFLDVRIEVLCGKD